MREATTRIKAMISRIQDAGLGSVVGQRFVSAHSASLKMVARAARIATLEPSSPTGSGPDPNPSQGTASEDQLTTGENDGTNS